MTQTEAEGVIQNVLASLLHRHTSDEGSVISLPTLYPSGAPVQVRVSFDGNQYFVNDLGNALNEADMLGAAPRSFQKHARDVAEQYGVLFDNHQIFAIHVSADQLSGAIRVVGSASQRAVVLTESQMAEQRDTTLKEEFVARLYRTFGEDRVTTDVTFRGQSSHDWTFAAHIRSERGPVLFDTATTSPLSIYGAHAKFSDLRRLERAPTGVIGIPSFRSMKPDYRNLLQQVANVVEATSSEHDLLQFA